MPYLIGTDEAGYGPNLGPLVVSATVWQVAGDPWDVDLYAMLADVVSSDAGDDGRIAIADSKALYKPGGTLRLLERGLLPVLAVADQQVDSWDDLWQTLGADPQDARDELPWYRGHRKTLPTAIDAAEHSDLTARLIAACRKTDVRPLRIRSRALFPKEFNERVERCDSKGAALSEVTLGLVDELLGKLGGRDAQRGIPNEPVLVVCDKHGGRNRYGPILQQQWPDVLVEVHGESRAASVYRWGPTDRRVEIRFCSGGEAFLPTALASMVSKHLRELSMEAFNTFWTMKVAGLRPTAGYPVDAGRFKNEIADAQQALGIDDRVLWRRR